MTSTEILLTLLFSPISILGARVLYPREPTDGSGRMRLIGGLALLALGWMFWIFLQGSRTLIGLLVVLVIPLLWLPASYWSRTLRNAGLALALLLAPLGLLVSLFSSFFSSKLTRTSISPDGRWEFRCYDEYGSTLAIAPRGLATWDPRAYPSRLLVSFGSSSAPEQIAWTGPREITATRDRPGGETARVWSDLGFRVLIRTRGEGMIPAGTPSPAASRHPR